MIFIKRNALILDCFTANPSAFEFAKPDHASKFMPNWWKNLPKVYETQFNAQTNMRHCAGFIDYFRVGVGLPMWSDLDVKIGKSGDSFYAWQYSDGESNATSHNPDEGGVFLDIKKVVHLKLIYPWRFKCQEDINWLWTQFGWQHPTTIKYQVLPGSLSFKYQTGANINILFSRQENESLAQFKFMEPLVHMAPMSEKKVLIKHHLIDEKEFLKIQKTVTKSSFVGTYKKIKKYLKENS